MTAAMRGPYQRLWLDSGYYETLLPNSPWHKINGSINLLLAQEVKGLPPQTELTSHILKLLGQQFIDDYLLNDPRFTARTLPKVAVHDKDDIQQEAKTWLNDKLQKIIKELKLKSHDYPDEEDEDLSEDCLEYIGFGLQVVYRGMERDLSAVEKNHDKSDHYFADSSQISGHQSEALGAAVSCILGKHPSCLKRVSLQLMGRHLPNTLRQLIWKIKIFKTDTSANNDDSHLNELKNQFMVAVKWGAKELGIDDPACSPIDGIIRRAVTEIYSLVPCIRDGNMRRICVTMATQALNILYVHDRSYEPHYALILLPLVWTYSGYASKQDFTSQNLAEYLYFLLKNCFPSRVDIFAIADHVISRLQQEDCQLFDHLIKTMKSNNAFDPREFLVNFMHKERRKALELEQALSRDHDDSTGDEKNLADAKSLLSHPIIFIRKWVGEGFVGVLDLPAILFIWDQCFLGNWQPSILENVCLTLLQLLRPKLMSASDYHGIKTVLLNHPHRIYTHDIQRGVVYLSNGGSLQDVGSLRQPSQPEVEISSLRTTPHSNQTSRARSIKSTGAESRGTTTVSSTSQVDLGELWIEKRMPTDSPLAMINNSESFDLYIDQVRFIPDNATIIKVTGRILSPFWKKPASLDVSDVDAYAKLDSPARCPQFHFRYPVFAPRGGISGDSVILLRVYTVDVDTAELVVIGNCAVNLYKQEDDKYFLNVGGRQLRLKHQLPSSVSRLDESLFTDPVCIPVVTLLVRILPHSEDFVEAPGYSSGYYDSSAFRPDGSENRIYLHYKVFEPYPPTVGEAIRDVREEEEQINIEEGISDQEMEKWYRKRMRKEQLDRKPARTLELMQLVQYDQNQGLCFSIEQAFGLPAATFVNVLTYISEGPTARIKGKTTEGFGGEESSFTNKRDFKSLQKSPKWVDDSKTIHPHSDPLSSLVIQLFSLDATYEPRADRQGPGSVLQKKGKILSLVPQGWTVLQLFKKKYVNGGLHHLPLFEGKPSSTFMEFLSAHPADVSLRQAVLQGVHQLQGTSSIMVRIWDGHYLQDSCIPLPVKEDLLSIGNQSKIRKTSQAKSGKAIADLVLQSLTKQERKGGISGQAFIREKDHFQEAMNSVFANLMENVLLELGLGPR